MNARDERVLETLRKIVNDERCPKAEREAAQGRINAIYAKYGKDASKEEPKRQQQQHRTYNAYDYRRQEAERARQREKWEIYDDDDFRRYYDPNYGPDVGEEEEPVTSKNQSECEKYYVKLFNSGVITFDELVALLKSLKWVDLA